MSALIKIIGLNLLQSRMLARQNRLKNLRRYHAAAVVLVDRWVQKNFEDEGRPAMGGSGWRPLSPATIANRRAEGAGARILQDTGQLKKRWKHLWDDKTGKLQSAVDYGLSHHTGRGWLPVRRILPLQQQVEKELKTLLDQFVKESIA